MDTEPESDVELRWNNLKSNIRSVVNATIEIQKNLTKKGWFNEECREAINNKNIARAQLLQNLLERKNYSMQS